MRGTVHALVAALVSLSLLAGCFSGEEAPPLDGEPRTAESEAAWRSFSAAEAAAREAAGGGNLVAAIGVATGNPGRLSVSGDFPGIASVIPEILVSDLVPGDGNLKAWAFLYEDSPGAGTLTAAVATLDEEGALDAQSVGSGVARSELVLLRTDTALRNLPHASPVDALNAAMSSSPWANVVRADGTFVLFVLGADESGTPEWQLVTSRYDPLDGFRARVDGQTGDLMSGAASWPDATQRDTQAVGGDNVNLKVPGEEEVFKITVDRAGSPALYVTAERSGTGEAIGDPVVELISPSGDSTNIGVGSLHTESNPEAGDWEVKYTWEVPDIYRTLQVNHCLQPIPFLFAEQQDACD